MVVNRFWANRPGLALGCAYWAVILAVDFINDWLLWGIAHAPRPWPGVARDVVLWWTTWLPFTPLILWLARRWSLKRRYIWAGVSRHLAVSLATVFLHLLLAAGTFTFLYPNGPSVYERITVWLGGFTLTEFLVYWGLVGLSWVFLPGPTSNRSADRQEADQAVHFAVKEKDRIKLVPVETVDWLEAEGNYIRVHVGVTNYLVRGTLQSALRRLDPRCFVRIHRSTVVNVMRLREVQPWFSGDYMAILENGQQLKVSRTFRTSLFEQTI